MFKLFSWALLLPIAGSGQVGLGFGKHGLAAPSSLAPASVQDAQIQTDRPAALVHSVTILAWLEKFSSPPSTRDGDRLAGRRVSFLLYAFIVLAHERRRILHFAVTESLSAHWVGQQLVNAFPFQTPLRFLLRDRDSIYGAVFTQRLRALGMKMLKIAPRSPWQNPYVERLIGTVRRECWDQLLILNAAPLHHLLTRFCDYYHRVRPHRLLDHDAPMSRPVEGPEQGQVIELPVLGGLHHRYSRRAA